MHAHRLPRNTLVTGELYHIELSNKFEVEKFLEWMGECSHFPFSIYLQGVTYTFTDCLQRDMFIVGFSAGREAGDICDNCIEE
jgi:hypothetical protein